MVDLHSHILPGLDDGVATVAESVELAREVAAGGVDAIAGTPHVRDDFPTTAEAMEQALARVQAAVAEAGVPLRVLPGGELALDQLDRREPAELRRFGLGGNSAYLLVEMPYYGWPLDLEGRLFRLRSAGFTPVLAHPERNGEVQADPGRVARLVRAGDVVQVTASSLAGSAGRRAHAAALQLLELGAVHLVAGDLHGPAVRREGLDAVADAVGDAALADWLTDGVPRAIVEGRPLPPRPEGRPRARSGLLGRLRR